ncbi:MAG: DedA family protein [Ignavibacteriaceae bacterium]|jgi:membrane protein DedA with SNARE-associated domain|nr:DedA family protein [Ignavibacteriaceae bacterium]
MFEHLFASLSTYNPILIYGLIILIPFIENLFPPSPSDIVLVLAGSLIVNGPINFFVALILSTVGSEIGFMVVYYIGQQTDRKIVHAGKLKFISPEAVIKAEQWFVKYGYALILFNRFLAGIRAVISFFAGLSELNVKRTFIYSTISAIAWNAILLALGILFGYNLSSIDQFLSNYTYRILIVSAIVAIYFLARYLLKRKD